MSMFCYQCQETAKNTGCTVRGVCGKTDVVSNLQDVLVFVVKGIANYSNQLRKIGKTYENVNKFLYEGLFVTITNANFDNVEKVLESVNFPEELVINSSAEKFREFIKENREREKI